MGKDPHNIKFFGMATIGEKGQIVIPANARKELGLNTGDKLLVIGGPKGKKLVVVKPEDFKEFATGISNHMKDLLKQLEQNES